MNEIEFGGREICEVLLICVAGEVVVLNEAVRRRVDRLQREQVECLAVAQAGGVQEEAPSLGKRAGPAVTSGTRMSRLSSENA